tara:strand:+ start:210 stop:467 length:258 start_codon:yes stop_codon:yes gene_type:complete
MELLISIEARGTNAVPVQISIIYDTDGNVEAIDWRHALPDIIDVLDLDEYDSDEDPDWEPPRHVSYEDDEILEYQSTDGDSDYSD